MSEPLVLLLSLIMIVAVAGVVALFMKVGKLLGCLGTIGLIVIGFFIVVLF